MIVLRKKRILLVLMCVIVSVGFMNITENLKNRATVPTVSLPVSNKVIVLDAGHRKSRSEEQKVKMGYMKMI